MRLRRWLMTIGVATGVTALVGVVALDGPPAADYDTDCANPTQTYTAANMPTNLNLTSTDVVEFQSGAFTGSVNAGGATICVAGPAFNPSPINGLVRLFGRGTALMPALAAESGAVLDSEGSVRFPPQVNVNGLATVINRVAPRSWSTRRGSLSPRARPSPTTARSRSNGRSTSTAPRSPTTRRSRSPERCS